MRIAATPITILTMISMMAARLKTIRCGNRTMSR